MTSEVVNWVEEEEKGEEEQGRPIITCTLKNEDGEDVESRIDLAERIGNNNGEFCVAEEE